MGVGHGDGGPVVAMQNVRGDHDGHDNSLAELLCLQEFVQMVQFRSYRIGRSQRAGQYDYGFLTLGLVPSVETRWSARNPASSFASFPAYFTGDNWGLEN